MIRRRVRRRRIIRAVGRWTVYILLGTVILTTGYALGLTVRAVLGI